jgi:hypothetical protein
MRESKKPPESPIHSTAEINRDEIDQIRKEKLRLAGLTRRIDAQLDSLEKYKGYMDALIHKYNPDQTSSLKQWRITDEGEVLWQLDLHDPGTPIREGRIKTEKIFYGRINEIYDDLAEYLKLKER